MNSKLAQEALSDLKSGKESNLRIVPQIRKLWPGEDHLPTLEELAARLESDPDLSDIVLASLAAAIFSRDTKLTKSRYLPNRETIRQILMEERWPLPFSIIREEELNLIKQLRARRAANPRASGPLLLGTDGSPEDIEKLQVTGLAFSGGGIRSATFNLGILQALAEFGLLEQFDYLSTVSGGGYIGGWLSAWFGRNEQGAAAVNQALSPKDSPKPDDERARPIQFLRKYSNYLTPNLGAFSADTWTVGSVYIRNLLLNLIILVAAIGAILLLPRALGWDLARGADGDFRQSVSSLTLVASRPWLHDLIASQFLPAAIALILMLISVAFIALNLKLVTTEGANVAQRAMLRRIGEQARTGYARQKWVQIVSLIPIMVASYLLCKWFWFVTFDKIVWSGAFVIFLILALVLQAGGGYWNCLKNRKPDNPPWLNAIRGATGFVTIPVACALIGTGLTYLFSLGVIWLKLRLGSGPWHMIIFGPPVIATILSFVSMIQMGLMGLDFPDSGREWLSRFRAWLNIGILGWLALFSAAIYAPLLVGYAERWITAVFSVGWLFTTGASVLAANSSSTDGNNNKSGLPSKLDILALIGPPVFIIGFVTILSFLTNLWVAHEKLSGLTGDGLFKKIYGNHWVLLNGANLWPAANTSFFSATLLTSIYPFMILLAVIALIFSWRVDINEFSMHHFYKNRLVRCYLGASRGENRRPNPFTGFDEADDLAISSLASSKTYAGPYPIVNSTLNITTGEQLAWQERKATSFIFSPLYSGFEAAGTDESTGPRNPHIRPFGYRRTEDYAYPDGGPAIGTAMAISGAAVNPNMGFYTSPTVAFLLTVFDVRLGWWLGNPRHAKKYRHSSPTLGLIYLVKELLGLTDDKAGFVNLSDGGHFENLGIYELVRRRCKLIVACDAEEDTTLSFHGLGNAIRKCRTDFGVEIDITPERIERSKKTGFSDTHCAIGTISYPDGFSGKLIYLKSSLVGDEPADILEYARSHPEFPHQTTADQWFTESQFESYRKLGYEVGVSTLRPAADFIRRRQGEENLSLYDALETVWYPPSREVQKHGTKHTHKFMQLMETLRGSSSLAFLGYELFPAQRAAIEAKQTMEQTREGFYFCISLIQLMEDIFLDFDLDNDSQFNHPDVQGWITLYRDWIKNSGTLQETWQSVKGTYSPRLEAFWNRLTSE